MHLSRLKYLYLKKITDFIAMTNKNNKMTTFQLLREHCSYLNSLDDETLTEMIDLSHELVASAGQQVLIANKPLEFAYIVLHGGFATVFTRDWGEDRILDQMGIGELLAEAELLNGDKCHSDIRALEEAKLLCVPRQFFISLTSKNPELWQQLSEHGRSRASRLLVTEYLSNLFGTAQLKISDPLLRLKTEEEWLDFEYEVLEKLKENAEWVRLKRGNYLFRQGDEADGAYIIVSGVLRVSIKQENGKELEIKRMYQGEIVGELALIADDNRSASIEALRECELFCLTPELLTHIAEKYPRVMLNVYRIISKRFRRSSISKSYRPKKSNIAILPIVDKGASSEFVGQLHKAMSDFDSVEYLDSQLVDEQLGRTGLANIDTNDPASTGLMQWLNGKEHKSHFVVYRADNEWSQWTARCVHQSDMIMIIADASNMPDFSGLNKKLQATGLSWSLIMLHPGDTDRPRGCAKWRIESGAKEIFHVRRNNQDDINRISRIVTGRALSLVLGGGGARGCAHIGALRALEERGIKVDMVGGTSSGSAVAAWIAQGNNSAQCQKMAHTAFKKIFDFTLPATSILQGRYIAKAITKQAASWDIEDYWLPFFCVSTNLTSASLVIHLTGNSARALRSSVSIPGVFPPVPENGELLVDGAVLNNLPIDIMRDLNPSGIILAIDVVPPNGSRAKDDYGLSLSGWKQLFRSLIPWLKAKRAPGIGAVIMQSMMLGSGLLREQVLDKKLADFYQNIHVKGVGMLEFSAIDCAVERGYESYINPLHQWLKSNDVGQKMSGLK